MSGIRRLPARRPAGRRPVARTDRNGSGTQRRCHTIAPSALYNVVRWTKSTKDHIPAYLEPFFSKTGFLCKSKLAQKDITDYGFINTATCGSTSSSVGSSEVALGRDSYALIPAMAWAIALAAAALLGSLAAGRWARWPAWMVTIPVILAIVWNLFESLSALLPNVY